ALPQAPAELVGELVDALFRRGDADAPEHLDGLVARAARVDGLVEQDRLVDLVADAVDGTERRHRLLEDQRDLGAADRAHLRAVRVELRQIDRLIAAAGARPPTKVDLALDDPPRPV